MPQSTLTKPQARALFDILTHWEVYSEIESFKFPEPIQNYGPPFTADDETPPSAPLLQLMVTRFATEIPGLRDIAPDFWQDKCRQLLKDCGEAELSESYDKGEIGLRRTLATAGAALFEYPARGCLGGFSMPASQAQKEREYDPSKAEDVIAAWEILIHELVHGDMLDHLYEKVAETDQLSDHTSLVQAAHEYIIVNLASLLYHIVVLSPDGESLVGLLDNVHKLIPYSIVRSSLKIGNAASMINAMVKLFLAKLSVGTLTNWAGWSTDADEGMNLLQQILSTVMFWDMNAFRKEITKIEKGTDCPSKEQLKVIKEYVDKSREVHQMTRARSEGHSKSMVTVILEDNDVSPEMSINQHAKAAEYLSHHLAIRDRERLIQIACKRQPDLLTQAIKDAVAAFDPIIRLTHQVVDLSESIWDTQCFLDDFIKLSKSAYSKKKSTKPLQQPSMEDFVSLLRKHQGSLHRFLHNVDKKAPELRKQFRVFCRASLDEFRYPCAPTVNGAAPDEGALRNDGAGAMTPALEKLFAALSESDREKVLSELDAHAAYLERLSANSAERMRLLLSKSERTLEGPGLFLARWEALMGESKLTPATSTGPVRRGHLSIQKPSNASDSGLSKTNSGPGSKGSDQSKESDRAESSESQPNVDTVIRTLGGPFRKLLQDQRFASQKHKTRTATKNDASSVHSDDLD
jgi:hypothetical protein